MGNKSFSGIKNKGKLPDYQKIHIPPEAEEFLYDFVESINSKLEELEAAVLACEGGNNYQENMLVARRILHSIKGEAGIIGITSIYELCHQAEFAFEDLGADELLDMLLNVKDWLSAAAKYLTNRSAAGRPSGDTDIKGEKISRMKFLIVEDDFSARKLLQRYLSDYGNCDIAVDGNEAVEAFRQAMDEEEPYDLICLDIMMPNMNGHEALKVIRQIEKAHGIRGLDGVKVVMTTILGDSKNIMGAFREGCEAYIVKPIERQKLLKEVEKLCSIKVN